MIEVLAENTNEAIAAVLVGCGGLGLGGLVWLVGWLQRPSPDAEAPAERRPHPLTAVFTRRARSDEDDD
ncbi:MAG: hypothetical protein AAF602_02850 [Myxococcota bacterium]